MKLVSLPSTDLTVSTFCLGCMPFGVQNTVDGIDFLHDKLIELLHRPNHKLGINAGAAGHLYNEPQRLNLFQFLEA